MEPTTQCSGLFGKLFGHNFQPAFSSEETFGAGADIVQLAQQVQADIYIEDALQAAKCVKSTYVKHVCTRCGQIR